MTLTFVAMTKEYLSRHRRQEWKLSKCVYNFNFLCLKVPEILRAECFEPVRYAYKCRRGTFDPDSASQRQFSLILYANVLQNLIGSWPDCRKYLFEVIASLVRELAVTFLVTDIILVHTNVYW